MSSSHGREKDVEMQSNASNYTANPMNGAPGSELGADDVVRESVVTAHSVFRTLSTQSSNSQMSATNILWNSDISYDRFVRLSKNMKEKIDAACKDWDEGDDESKFLDSSHLILYKWHDYMSIPQRHPFANILYGSREKDKEGRFIVEDNHCRFLFVFHDSQSLFVMGLSYLVVFGEISILVAIVLELLNQNCNSDIPKGTITLVPLILCTLYASSVASASFFRFTPFELTGQSLESYCAIADILVKLGKTWIPYHINFNLMFREDLNRIAEADPSRREAINKALLESGLRDTSTFLLTIALQFANFLLLTTVAIVMGTSQDLLSLIQNFVSVEIVVHIHEFIPKALRLRDQSPHSFNSSFTAV